MLVGLDVQERPEGETLEVRATVPVNPLTGATVIVDVAAAPAKALTLVGLALTVKSVTVTATVAVWTIDPLVPVTVTVKLPFADARQDKLDELLTDRLEVPRLHASPVEGETVEVRVTVPMNPFRNVTVTSEVPVPPDVTSTLVGLAVMVKSETRKRIDAVVWVREPAVPVTVTV